MNKLDRSKAKQLLRTVRDFILRDVLKDDKSAQYEVTEIFRQLLTLLDQRQGD